MQRILELLGQLFAVLPPWAVPIVAAGLAAVAIPPWLRYIGVKQVRGNLRRAFYAKDPAERARWVDAAFERAGDKPALLARLAEDALKMGLKPAYNRALSALEAAGGHPEDVRRLRSTMAPEQPKRGGHPVEEALVIERMLRDGLVEAARERLASARARFGDDPELADVARHVEAASAPVADRG